MNIDLTNELIIQALGWVIMFGIFIVRIDKRMALIAWKVDELNERQAKYNNLQERMASVEASAKSAHHRLDLAGVGTNWRDRK